MSLLGILVVPCAFVACDPDVQIEPSNGGSGGAAGAGGQTGGSGGTISTENDAGQVEDGADASNDAAVEILDQSLACASRTAACAAPASSDLASGQLETLYAQCCMEVSCGCNARCQTTTISFDENGCATQMAIDGYISSALADCLRKYLTEQRWECASKSTATHVPLCNPC